MVKSIISIIVVAILISAGALFEGLYVKNEFTEFKTSLTVLYDKIESEKAVESDVLAVQKKWIEHKKHLSVFIPHTEIKEIEMWVAETVSLVKDKSWEDAVSKVEVLIELVEQIPKAFKVSIETIF